MKSAMQNSGKRWFIAVMATLVHLCLEQFTRGVFPETVSETFGLGNPETVWAFKFSHFMLGVTFLDWGGQIYRNSGIEN